MSFTPKRIFFEKESLNYPLGEDLYRRFKGEGIPITIIGSHNRVTGIPGKTPQEAYLEAKQTLVIGVRKTLKFASCKPSAHYQLPLSTSCIGKCEYCYLNTTLGKKPCLRVYVNIEEILEQAGRYIAERRPEITYFEGAATSDPLPYEKYTGALGKAIRFFAGQENGRFRFVTKFTDVLPLLEIEHKGHTRFRFSINTQKVIGSYEHQTPSALERIEAAGKVALARYPLGFLIAPVMIYSGWQDDYASLLDKLAHTLKAEAAQNLTFEIIAHRFTKRAKSNILEVFPQTTLPMDEETRKYKYGQFGYGKYVYTKEEMEQIKVFFQEQVAQTFPQAGLDYIV